jgi:hypothetical protein
MMKLIRNAKIVPRDDGLGFDLLCKLYEPIHYVSVMVTVD